MCYRQTLERLDRHGPGAGNRDADLAGRYAQFMANEILLQSDAHPSAGLALHLTDILLPEFTSMAQASSTPKARRNSAQPGGPPAKSSAPAEALHAFLAPLADAMAWSAQGFYLPIQRIGMYVYIFKYGQPVPVKPIVDAAHRALPYCYFCRWRYVN